MKTVKEKIEYAVAYINSLNLGELQAGRYDLSDGIFYSVQEYMTKPADECRFESHKRYIDIQWIVNGCEKIYIADTDKLKILSDYDDDKDIAFWHTDKECCSCVLTENSYVILYSDDAHMPGVCVAEPEKVKKIVIKIPY